MKFYVLLDTSGSMEGVKIDTLNDAMSNIVTELKQMACSANLEMSLSVLSFGKDVKWMNDYPVKADGFTWNRISASGMTPLGKACIELNRHLISDNKISEDDNCIILLSDGCPTDDYEEGLNTLFSNSLFTNANRFAIAIGDNADIPALSKFVEIHAHVYIQNKVDKLFDILYNIIGECKKVYSKESSIQKHSN